LRSPFVEDVLALIFELTHLLLHVIDDLALPNVFNFSCGSEFLLMIEFVPGFEVLALYFSHFLVELMVIDLIFDEMFLMLLDLSLRLLEPGVELVALLGEFGVLLPLRVELPRQLHYSLLLKSLIFHYKHIKQAGE
jgi:hypothetical protein